MSFFINENFYACIFLIRTILFVSVRNFRIFV
uniref:Uncharacterized protein n=1 Tax=Lepeophtheirus salmonis TaxID=72036 RepID=A0A0K2VL33_LEPSM